MTSRDELARAVAQRLGLSQDKFGNWITNGHTIPKPIVEALIDAELRVKELREALRIAAEESWAVKNGLMEIRDSAELDPVKDEWISAKIGQWQAGAGMSEESK